MPPQNNRRGIFAMLIAMCFFITNDMFLKLASAVHPPGQIMAVRGIFASILALAIVVALRQLGSLPKSASAFVLMRAGLEAIVAFLFITGLARLPIANITAITQSTPIIMTLLTVMLGIERVRWRRWTAIMVGFLGVLAIVRPSAEGFDVYALVALAAAVLVSGRDLATRFIGSEVPTPVVTFSTTVTVGLAGALAGFTETWPPPAARELAYIVSAAASVTLGSLAIVVAFRDTDVSVVSPFRYSIILLAIFVGYLVWGELPDAIGILGIALIVGSGVYMVHREQVRMREALRRETAEARSAA
jgi:drug/metabolite transporter (DMT)-like permease